MVREKTHRRLAALMAALAWLLPAAAGAQNAGYTLQPLVKQFEPGGPIPPDSNLLIQALNDGGQLLFIAGRADRSVPERLIQHSDGKLAVIAEPEREIPGGAKWPADLWFYVPVSMNERGDVVYSALADINPDDVVTRSAVTLLWEREAAKSTAVALPGMPGTDQRVFEGGGGPSPAIGRGGEIAFVAAVKNAAGRASTGIFLRRSDGGMTSVALPDGPLPGGATLADANFPSLNEAGVILFHGRREGFTPPAGIFPQDLYLWENGTTTLLASSAAEAPGTSPTARFARWHAAFLSKQDRTALILARLDHFRDGPLVLYRFAEGRLSPVLLPGQPLPDGGRYKAIQASPFSIHLGLSAANSRGEHAFIATLEDGSEAAYLLGPDGKMSLIMKTGTSTNLGTVSHLGTAAGSYGIALNDRGQVALGVRIDGGSPVVALLTSASP